MELERLMQAVQELLGARSQAEAEAALQRHPELLEESSLNTLLGLAEAAGNAGERETAELLGRVAQFLRGLSQAEGGAKSSGEEAIAFEPVTPESSVPWARLTRQHLALRREEFLAQAITEAQQSGEADVVALLRATREQDWQKVDEAAPQLYRRLIAAGRNEEGATIALVGLDLRAGLAEMFMHFPLDQQAAALEAGLRACREAAAFARALGDEACQAFYKATEGTGYARWRRLSEAEAAYGEGLKLYRKLAQAQPAVYEPDVAMTLNNLGTVLSDLRRLSEAEAAYGEGLQLCRRHDLPVERSKILSGRSQIQMDRADWGAAADTLQEAVEQVERLRTEALNLDRRLQILRENIHIYERLLICLMKLGRYQEALEVAERGKSRTLIDLLTLRDLRPKNAPSKLAHEYERMLFRARALEDRLQRGEVQATGSDDLPPEERSKRQQEQIKSVQDERLQTNVRLQELVNEIRRHDPDFLPHARPLNLAEIKSLAQDAQATLMLFRVTEAGSFIFLIFPDGATDVVQEPEFTTAALNEMLVKFDGGKAVDGWMVRYYGYHAAVDQARQTKKGEDEEAANQAWQAWLKTMDATLGDLYRRLLKRAHEQLKHRKSGDGVERVVMIPNRGLAVLPLQACWWNGEDGGRRYLLDDYVVTYAPSLSVFKRCLERERAGRSKQTLLGVANPKPPGNLAFSEWECEEIEEMLGDERCLFLWGEEATKAELMKWVGERNWLHFSCGGQHRMDAPLLSSLSLAQGDELSLGEIMEKLNLQHTWLIVLSGSGTALMDFREIADEHYGLPLGFLFAGAPTVWGTLWTVNDLTTALLMIEAYKNLTRDGASKPDALRDAQRWLRDATAERLLALVAGKETALGYKRMAWHDVSPFRRRIEIVCDSDPQARLFSHPYYWAGMQCVGV